MVGPGAGPVEPVCLSVVIAPAVGVDAPCDDAVVAIVVGISALTQSLVAVSQVDGVYVVHSLSCVHGVPLL